MTEIIQKNTDIPENDFLIPVESLFSDFINHLNIENNSRIFFSGKFGIGKSFFLHEFFEHRKENYETFHLFPVNYQISSNEDIIELLKYDILIELLRKNHGIFGNKKEDSLKGKAFLFYSFCKNKFSIKDFLQSLLSSGESITELTGNLGVISLGKLGRPFSQLLDLDKEYQEFKREYQAGDKGKVETYLNEMKEKVISETDYLSYLLREKIIEQKGLKKSVLILDDLDRIDPEHIFRILNVFSAHFDINHDRTDLPNKFGFDRIILVGDRKNIQSIFHHRYGLETDFEGYFNKFFNFGTYSFENSKIIIDYIGKLVTEFGKNAEGQVPDAMKKSGYARIILEQVLLDAIILDSKEKLNLRQILKLVRYRDPLQSFSRYPRDNRLRTDNETILQFVNFGIRVMIIIYDNENNLVNALTRIRDLSANNIKNSPEEFNFLSVPMFEAVTNEPLGKPEEIKEWGEYKVSKRSNGMFEWIESKTGEKNSNKKLFYDLLISYIKNKKYENENKHW